MSQPQNVLLFNARIDATGAKGIALPELVRTAKQSAEKQLEPLFSSLFNKIDDALFELANKSDNSTVQSLYFDAMREVRLHKSAILGKFAAGYNKGFMDSVQSGRSPSVEPASLQLALINEDELEESIAVRNMIDKAAELHADALYCLSQRLGAAIPSATIDESNNPFGPEVLCDSFRSAVNTLELDLKVKLVIYKLFDKFVIQHLATVYEAANTALVRGGLLPHLKGAPQSPTIVRAPGRDGTPAADSRDEQAPDGAKKFTGALPAELLAQQVETFELLQQLLAAQRSLTTGGVGAAPQSGVGGVPLTADEMLSSLSSIQHNIGDVVGQAGDGPLNLRSQVMLQFGQQGEAAEREISQTHADVIDVVGMMFDFILDDRELPDAIKGLIARLQIPMLKVALLDREFFGKKSHPARQLLNELAHAGIGLDEIAEVTVTPIYGKIEHIVGRILQEFEDDQSIFGELLQELFEFQAQESELWAQMQSCLEQSRLTAAEVVEPLLQSAVMPEVLGTLLNTSWKEHLAELYLSVGGKNEEWEQMAALAASVVDSIQPKTSADERTALMKRIPRLLADLRGSVVIAGMHAEDSENLFRELEARHMECLRQKSVAKQVSVQMVPQTPARAADSARPTADKVSSADAPAKVHPLPVGSATDEHPGTTAPEMDSVFDDEIVLAEENTGNDEDLRWGMEYAGYAAMVRELEVGTWLGFVDEDGGVRRGKLAWKSDVMGEYVFVDSFFKVVRDTTLKKLVAEFASGQVLMTDEVPLMDRALDSVMGALKKYKDKVSTETEEPIMAQ
jgi:hypothetical protein